MDLKTVGAFVEYVGRPLLEDARIVLEKLEALKLPIERADAERAVKVFIGLHLAVEVLRAMTYIVVAWLVCATVRSVL